MEPGEFHPSWRVSVSPAGPPSNVSATFLGLQNFNLRAAIPGTSKTGLELLKRGSSWVPLNSNDPAGFDSLWRHEYFRHTPHPVLGRTLNLTIPVCAVSDPFVVFFSILDQLGGAYPYPRSDVQPAAFDDGRDLSITETTVINRTWEVFGS
jgi:hypothetical protein